MNEAEKVGHRASQEKLKEFVKTLENEAMNKDKAEFSYGIYRTIKARFIDGYDLKAGIKK